MTRKTKATLPSLPTAAEDPPKYLRLDVSSRRVVTRERDPDDEWSGEDTSTSWTVEGITLLDKDEYNALPADFPVEVGDTVYVVYAVYSTGDSFSHDENGEFETVCFFKTREKAHAAARAVSQRTAGESYQMTFETESGAKISRYCPWDGYFERLSYVEVESFEVEDSQYRRRYYPTY